MHDCAFHGQVRFCARVVWDSKSDCLKLEMERAELGASCRFTRRWGSDFLLRIRVHKDVLNGDKSRRSTLESFLLQPVAIFGRIYRFFHASSDHVAFFAAVNETLSTILSDDDSSQFPSLWEFISWHNPIHSNVSQVHVICSAACSGS